MSDITKMGFLDSAELKEAGRYPSEERLAKGPVAVIECCQNIPCNPCETACKFGAIQVGDPITNLPVLDETKCIGCGVCITKCPGLAIFVVDKSKEMATVSFPFEYLPLPEKGIPAAQSGRKSRPCRAECAGRPHKFCQNCSFCKSHPLVLHYIR